MSDEAVHPPRRSRELLRQWVDDYASETSLNGARVDVAPQEDGGDGDTGLVILRPHGSTLSVYMQPRGYDDPVWELTIPERHHDVTMTPLELGALASVVLDAARLCTYLQFRSLDRDRSSGLR